MDNYIEIKGARENNLKNISLKIPKNKLVVLTGISGQGKSTLAFDTLQKECQRQYMASLGMVTDFISKPKVDCINGLSPSISVDQYLTNRNPRSTVGTVTEVFTYLRLLYSKLGERPCPYCGEIIKPSFEDTSSNNIDLWDSDETQQFTSYTDDTGNNPGTLKCSKCGKLLPELIMADFSFNKPNGACPACNGSRLKAESRSVTVAGEAITELSKKSLEELDNWARILPMHTSESGLLILQPVLDDLASRINRLLDVGLGYLSMERPATSLSGGEAQRLRLASLLGSGLTGVLYVLDEPTTGLHPRDTDRLISVLKQLRDMGNTVLVIEHDIEMMRAAEHIIDIGPGAGMEGGCLVASGTPAEVADSTYSITGRYLSGKEHIPLPETRRTTSHAALIVEGAREHNLKDLNVEIPLGMMVALTGVSGSGKSTLLFDIIDKAASQRYYGTGDIPGRHERITGWEYIDKVITIDQTPIGRIPRSNAATYTVHSLRYAMYMPLWRMKKSTGSNQGIFRSMCREADVKNARVLV